MHTVFMSPASTFFLHFAFSQLLLCTLLLAPFVKHNESARWFALLTLCGCGYLIGMMEIDGALKMGLYAFSFVAGNALPGVFWLVSLTVFADRLSLHKWQIGLASLTLLIPLISRMLDAVLGLSPSALPALFDLLKYGSMALELALVVYALVVAMVNWRNDLVEERRLMRGSMIGFVAAYLFAVIVVEQVIGVTWPWLVEVKFVALCILTTGVNVLFFSLRENTLFAAQTARPQVTKPTRQSNSPEVEKITHAMKTSRLYREEGLTISRLSRHLSIHEYKLRQLINGELGYRNFNDFLNDYRIREVTEQLKLPDNVSTPILTLALDSGFRSLSSFNKAFKEKHGLTPSEFRNLQVNQS